MESNENVAGEAEFVCEIARHQGALHAFIISMIPGLDGVEDVLQETNIVLWNKRGTFEPGTNFRAWAFSIARYKAMNHRQKRARQGMEVLSDDLLELLSSEFEERADQVDDRVRALEKCLRRLNTPEMDLIEQRYYSGTTMDHLAERSNRSLDSLRVTLFRIRAALRKCINAELALTGLNS
ncbi:MAG: sigma-70 family RNA polymerase sigma factor [Verrucomicrobiota bacterium]